MDGLTLSLTGSYVNDLQNYRDFRPYFAYNANKSSEPSQLDERYYRWDRTNYDALLNYEKSFGQHNLKALAGWHTEKYNYRYHKDFRHNFPTNDLTDLNAGDAATQTNEGYTRELFRIVLPLVWPTFTTVMVMALMAPFSVYLQPMFLTKGMHNTKTISFKIFESTQGGGAGMEYWATFGLFLSLIGAPIILAIRKIMERCYRDVDIG